MSMNNAYAEIDPPRAEIDAIEGPTLLEFGAEWCPHCRGAQPLVVSALASYPHVQHLKIADGRGHRLGRSFRVKLWPTLIFLRNGKELVRLVRPEGSEPIGEALALIDASDCA